MSLQKVIAKRDESSHWYVIPETLQDKWIELSDLLTSNLSEYEREKAEDEFVETFDKYRTGGDLNNVQLYADIE